VSLAFIFKLMNKNQRHWRSCDTYNVQQECLLQSYRPPAVQACQSTKIFKTYKITCTVNSTQQPRSVYVTKVWLWLAYYDNYATGSNTTGICYPESGAGLKWLISSCSLAWLHRHIPDVDTVCIRSVNMSPVGRSTSTGWLHDVIVNQQEYELCI